MKLPDVHIISDNGRISVINEIPTILSLPYIVEATTKFFRIYDLGSRLCFAIKVNNDNTLIIPTESGRWSINTKNILLLSSESARKHFELVTISLNSEIITHLINQFKSINITVNKIKNVSNA